MASQPTVAAQLARIAPASMLRMASTWQKAGQINQAISTYARIMKQYPESAEAGEAADRLLALAQAYEQQGLYRLALGVYNRLERLA